MRGLHSKCKGRVKAIHYIQSFDPKDNISPELAHRIGKAFALKVFGKDSQVVIATHVDKKHIHTHFILNSYGVDGHKFNDNKETLQKIREQSDRVCLAFGVKPIETNRGVSKNIEHNEWEHKQSGTSWKEKIRTEIDRLIGYVKNIDELLAELEMLGYTIKRGKYISVKVPEQQRAVRLKMLRKDYTPESLASRILWKDVGSGVKFSGEPSELRDRYTSTIDEIERLAPYSPQNDLDVYKLSAQLTIINRDNLRSIREVEGKVDQLRNKVEKARQELNALISKQDTLIGLAEQAEEYFSLLDKPTRTPAEELRIKMYKTVLESNNIRSHSDYDYLKKVNSEAEQKTEPLKKHFEWCRQLYDLFSDIAKTYHEISQRDYINKLIEQPQKQDTPQTYPLGQTVKYTKPHNLKGQEC